MGLEDVPPFAKVGGIVFGLAVFGLLLRFCPFGTTSYARSTCDALAMDQIDDCLKRASSCKGTVEEAHACIDRAAEDAKNKSPRK